MASSAKIRSKEKAAAAEKRGGLLRQQVELRPRGDAHQGKEIVPIAGQLSEDKGLYTVVRAIQLLKTANSDRLVIVGLGGPSGAGKTEFSRRLGSIIPLLHISLDSYAIGQKLQEQGKTDCPSMTDFDLLIQNIAGLQSGEVEIPVFDFKKMERIGYKRVRAPDSHVVLVEGMYALYPKVCPFIDLRVAISGGVHFDLIKRIMRDTGVKSKSDDKTLREISEAVFPNYKAFIEPDLKTAHVRVRNHYNPFSGFLHNATYTLKSTKTVTEHELETLLQDQGPGCTWEKGTEETTDIFLLPPGEDQETCKNWIRMRRRDGHYSLVFEEYISDGPMLISPSMSFEVNIQLLGGLLSLGYQLGAVITRFSTTYECADVSFKFDDVDVLKQRFFQLQSKTRETVEMFGKMLDLDGTYTPKSYIELLQLERLQVEVTQDVNKLLHVPSHIVLSPTKNIPLKLAPRSDSPSRRERKPSQSPSLASIFSEEGLSDIQDPSQNFIMKRNVSRVYSDSGSERMYISDDGGESHCDRLHDRSGYIRKWSATNMSSRGGGEGEQQHSENYLKVKQQLAMLRQSQDSLVNQITCLGMLASHMQSPPSNPISAVTIGVAGCMTGVGLLAMATQMMFMSSSSS